MSPVRLRAGEDEQALAAAVAAWAGSVIPRIEAAELTGALPAEVVRGLADLGVLRLTVPEDAGGLGASMVAFALALEELAAVWPSLAVAAAVNGGPVIGSLVRHGTTAQRATWLPRLMNGDGLGAFALSEPDAGSDAAALRATAVPDGSGWLITGRKVFVTNAHYAPLAIVFARVASQSSLSHAGITAFLVPLPSPSLFIERAENKMGLLASDTSPLTFDNVHVPADGVLGEIGGGFRIAMEALDGGRIGIGAQAVGIARGAIAKAIRYVKERQQFGAPLANLQATQFALAKARTEIDAARLLVLRAAWRKDQGLPFSAEAAMAKLWASEAAQRATYTAVQLHGGYGYVREYGVERYARDARATTIYEGTSEVQRLVIARSLVKA